MTQVKSVPWQHLPEHPPSANWFIPKRAATTRRALRSSANNPIISKKNSKKSLFLSSVPLEVSATGLIPGEEMNLSQVKSCLPEESLRPNNSPISPEKKKKTHTHTQLGLKERAILWQSEQRKWMSTPDVSVKSVWSVSALVPAHKSERGREKERWGNVVWVKGVWKLSLSLYSILLFWLLCPVIPHQTDLKSVPSLFLKLVQKQWEECEHLALLQSTKPGAAHGPVAVTSSYRLHKSRQYMSASTSAMQTPTESLHVMFGN